MSANKPANDKIVRAKPVSRCLPGVVFEGVLLRAAINHYIAWVEITKRRVYTNSVIIRDMHLNAGFSDEKNENHFKGLTF